MKNEQLLVALDVDNRQKAMMLASKLCGIVGGFKVGKRLFVKEGPDLVRDLVAGQARVFLDLKFHDIPNTVAQAVEAAAALGVWVCNVHCQGGPDMLKAARDASHKYGAKHGYRPLVIGVTVLTSHTSETLNATGYSKDVSVLETVKLLAGLAIEAGLDGVVCSAQEAMVVRQMAGDKFLIITPGIRLTGAKKDDQERVDTPAGAKRAGASHLVVGRPIIEQTDPAAAAQRFVKELEAA